jgi:3-oxoacyl-(acyl-carrier-protein) synthase
VLEEAGRARDRGATVHADLLGGAHGTVLRRDPACYAAVVLRALTDAGCGPDDIDLVLCEGAGRPDSDGLEMSALAAVFRSARAVPVTAPKTGFGHLYGAAFATDMVSGVLAGRDAVLPPTPGASTGDMVPRQLELVKSARPAPVTRCLVVSHSRYGTCVAMVLGRSQ